jgi:sterol desaturase/sphingolipid hydroxylase (fatty acid hydroxylase superfamily)
MYYFVLHIVCYDLWYYFTHICLHNIAMYKYHKLHHLVRHDNIRYNDAFAGHIIEYPIQTIGIFVPNVFIEFQLRTLVCVYIFVTIRSYLNHDHRCTWLVGNHHLLHHKHPKYNFGEKWTDAIFGTLYIPIAKDVNSECTVEQM